MVRKRYRVTIECDVQVDDLTMDFVQARAARRPEPAPEWVRSGWAHRTTTEGEVDAMRALQEELFKSPRHLDLFIQNWIWEELLHLEEDARPESPSESDILRPVIERLPPRARHWWRQTLFSGDDDLFERTDDFFSALSLRLGPVAITEVNGEGAIQSPS